MQQFGRANAKGSSCLLPFVFAEQHTTIGMLTLRAIQDDMSTTTSNRTDHVVRMGQENARLFTGGVKLLVHDCK